MSSPIPRGVDVAAAWSWRLLVIGVAAGVLAWLFRYLSVVVIPVVVALLIAALLVPMVNRLHRGKLARGPAAGIVVVAWLLFLGAALTLVGQQIVDGFSDLSEQVVRGLQQIEVWLRTGPLQLSDAQFTTLLEEAQNAVTTSNEQVVARVTDLGTALGHIVAGFFIVLFALFFFLYDGERIWTFLTRLFPGQSGPRVDSSGRVAWTTLTAFVRATVVVAFVDALGIMLVALVLKVPLAVPIGVLVFLGAFVPIVGALVSGFVAVLVALVAHGPVIALLMLGGVLLVQQVESHVLQPFLLGRAVKVHPLAVILAVATGVLVAGVVGALVAVPIVASLNAVVRHLSTPPQPPAPEAAEATAEAETGPLT
ncbi:MAG TPA: AI-2E family transporter [Nocardioidaceae bacterium]|nr:AI-2E family transporter [Nocardioidaceae bacterium]